MHPEESASGRFVEYESLNACPVCGSADFFTAFEPDVVRCAECRVYFRNPRPTQAEIKRSYDVGSNYAEWQQRPAARNLEWKRRIGLILPFIQRGKLLDIGSGDGHFLYIAKAAGFETCGTEISLAGAQYAKERGHQLLIGQLKEIDFNDAQFDVITIWHVLEHLPNPGEALRIISSRLKPGGIMVVAVPNEDNHLFRRRLGGRRGSNPLGPLIWSKEIHITHFQPATLRTALVKAGLVPIRFGVDDIYYERSLKNVSKLWMQKSLSAVLQWHFSMAMYFVCKKEG